MILEQAGQAYGCANIYLFTVIGDAIRLKLNIHSDIKCYAMNSQIVVVSLVVAFWLSPFAMAVPKFHKLSSGLFAFPRESNPASAELAGYAIGYSMGYIDGQTYACVAWIKHPEVVATLVNFDSAFRVNQDIGDVRAEILLLQQRDVAAWEAHAGADGLDLQEQQAFKRGLEGALLRAMNDGQNDALEGLRSVEFAHQSMNECLVESSKRKIRRLVDEVREKAKTLGLDNTDPQLLIEHFQLGR